MREIGSGAGPEDVKVVSACDEEEGWSCGGTLKTPHKTLPIEYIQSEN